MTQHELMRFGENLTKQTASGRQENQGVEDENEMHRGESLNAAAGFRLVFIR